MDATLFHRMLWMACYCYCCYCCYFCCCYCWRTSCRSCINFSFDPNEYKRFRWMFCFFSHFAWQWQRQGLWWRECTYIDNISTAILPSSRRVRIIVVVPMKGNCAAALKIPKRETQAEKKIGEKERKNGEWMGREWDFTYLLAVECESIYLFHKCANWPNMSSSSQSLSLSNTHTHTQTQTYTSKQTHTHALASNTFHSAVSLSFVSLDSFTHTLTYTYDFFPISFAVTSFNLYKNCLKLDFLE